MTDELCQAAPSARISVPPREEEDVRASLRFIYHVGFLGPHYHMSIPPNAGVRGEKSPVERFFLPRIRVSIRQLH